MQMIKKEIRRDIEKSGYKEKWYYLWNENSISKKCISKFYIFLNEDV